MMFIVNAIFCVLFITLLLLYAMASSRKFRKFIPTVLIFLFCIVLGTFVIANIQVFFVIGLVLLAFSLFCKVVRWK